MQTAIDTLQAQVKDIQNCINLESGNKWMVEILKRWEQQKAEHLKAIEILKNNQ